MNINDIIKYGHQTVLQAIDGYPEEAWERTGAVGFWSPKNIVAHLASFELLLTDAVSTLVDDRETPHLDAFQAGGYNDVEVPKRQHMTPPEVIAEYTDANRDLASLIATLSPERCRETGTLPWYGAEYSLDDLVVYMSYGHKREHCAQLKLFRKRFE